MNDDFAQRCVADVKLALQSIAELTGKIVSVYSEEELMDASKGIAFPCIGVVYEGMRSSPEPGSAKTGMAAELIVSLIMVERAAAAGESYTKNAALATLDDTRKALIGRQSPTGHKWRFIMEAPASEKKGTIIWLQRWATPAMLTK